MWSCDIPQKNLGPIGSAVLTFIGYKQTDRQTDTQTDKPNLYIDLPELEPLCCSPPSSSSELGWWGTEVSVIGSCRRKQKNENLEMKIFRLVSIAVSLPMEDIMAYKIKYVVIQNY